MRLSNLTSGRITYATSNGQLTDDADLTFDGTTLGGRPATFFGAVTGTHGTFGQITGSSLKLTGSGLIGALTGSTLRLANLTSGRVAYATSNGQLTDSSKFTFDGTTLGGKPAANLGAITGSTYTATGPVYFDSVTTNVGALTGSGLWIYTGEVTIGAEADMGQVILTGSFTAATIAGKPGSDLGAITGSAIYLRGGPITGSELSITKTIAGKPGSDLGAVTGTHGTFGQVSGSLLRITGDAHIFGSAHLSGAVSGTHATFGQITGSSLNLSTSEVTIGTGNPGTVTLTGSFACVKGALSGTTLRVANLTSGRATFATSNGQLTDSAYFTFSEGSGFGTLGGKPAATLGAVSGTHATFGQITGSLLRITGDAHIFGSAHLSGAVSGTHATFGQITGSSLNVATSEVTIGTGNPGTVTLTGSFSCAKGAITGSSLLVKGPAAFSGPAGTFSTFSSSDITPSVKGGNLFKTHASGQTLRMFDDGVAGQIITVISTAAVVYDVTSTNLKGGSTNITTANGDVTQWVFDGTNWYLLQFMDVSANMSSVAAGMTNWVLEDGDGTEVTVTNAKEVKFVEGAGIDINWTDTSPGSNADPYDLTFACNLEGTELASTGESGGDKFLREDGDGTCSWQDGPAGTITALNNQTEGRLVSIGSTTTELDGEANLIFNGSILELTGNFMSTSLKVWAAGAKTAAPLNRNAEGYVSIRSGEANSNYIPIDELTPRYPFIVTHEGPGAAAHIENDGENISNHGLSIQCGTDAFAPNESAGTPLIFLAGNGVTQGKITFSGGTVSYGAFTANHDVSIPEEDNENGYPYGTLIKIISTTTGPERKKVNYSAEKTTQAKDKAVFGVYSRKYPYEPDIPGGFDEENFHSIFCLGDGHILVCSEGGDIELGDYICSSNTVGHGKKQDDDLLHNYTVAKATEPVIWANESGTTKLITCTYHSA